MAPSLDRILSGLGQGLSTFAGLQTQANRYKDQQAADKADRERQIERDALSKALSEAQIGNLNADNERQDRAAALETYKLMFPTTPKSTGSSTPEAFQEFVGPQGSGVYRIPRGGQPQFMGRSIPKPADTAGPTPAKQKVQIGAANAIDALDKAEELLAANPDADLTPQASAAMEGLSHIPLVGGMLKGTVEAQRQQMMTPAQQEFQAYMDTMLHNSVGLLPGSRQSLVLFQNLRQSYVPSPGQSPQARAAKREMRRHLRRRLEQLSKGEAITEEDLSAPNVTEAPASIARPHLNSQGQFYDNSGPPKPQVDPSRYFRP